MFSDLCECSALLRASVDVKLVQRMFSTSSVPGDILVFYDGRRPAYSLGTAMNGMKKA